MDRAAKQTGRAFRLTRRFEASREKVFAAWTKPEVLKEWWCPPGWVSTDIELDVRPGGTFRVGMRRLTGGMPVCVHGVFQEVRVPDKLTFTWRWENAFEGMPETRVIVEFKDVGRATELSLTHEMLPEIPICLQHRTGWIEALYRLQVVYGSPKQ